MLQINQIVFISFNISYCEKHLILFLTESFILLMEVMFLMLRNSE